MITAEECVLYLCYNSKTAYLNFIRNGLKSEYFSAKLLPVFTKISEYRLHNECNQIPVNLYGGDMREKQYIMELAVQACDNGVIECDWEKYFDEMKNEYNRRVVSVIIKKFRKYSYEEIVEICTQMINAVDGNNTNVAKMEDTYQELLHEFNDRQSPSYDNPYRTGISKYDSLGHYEPGSLLVLGGSSGHGKSTLAINLMYRWAKQGLPVLYFSYEMTPMVVAAKLNCIHTQIPWDKAMNIRGETLPEEKQTKFKIGLNDLRNMPLWINDRLQQLPEIIYTINFLKPKVFIVDTVNHLIDQADKERFWIFLGHVARELKEVAKRHRILAVVIAQLREYIGRPTSKYFIAESRQLVNTADYMDFIFRAKEHNILDCPEALKNILEVYRVKGRLTGIGSAFLYIDETTGYVRNLSYSEEVVVTEALKSHVKLLAKKGKG